MMGSLLSKRIPRSNHDTFWLRFLLVRRPRGFVSLLIESLQQTRYVSFVVYDACTTYFCRQPKWMKLFGYFAYSHTYTLVYSRVSIWETSKYLSKRLEEGRDFAWVSRRIKILIDPFFFCFEKEEEELFETIETFSLKEKDSREDRQVFKRHFDTWRSKRNEKSLSLSLSLLGSLRFSSNSMYLSAKLAQPVKADLFFF